MAADTRTPEQRRAALIRRIQAMRFVGGRTPDEAAAFMAKAAELMTAHQITERELAHTDAVTPVTTRRVVYRMGNANGGVWHLLHEVGAHYGVRTVGHISIQHDPGQGRDVSTFRGVMVGRAGDIEMLQTLADVVLIPQMMADVARVKPRSRRSFCRGWADTVANRIGAQQRMQYTEAGMALVPVAVDVEAKVDEITGGRKGGSISIDINSTSAGRRAGLTADIGNTQVGGSPSGSLAAGS